MKKAFDTVDHTVLYSKMKRYGLNELTLRFFRSYLENRPQSCFVNGHLSHISYRLTVMNGKAPKYMEDLFNTKEKITLKESQNCLQNSCLRPCDGHLI